eukprot:CAMPEP_0168620868 /NCGR_PEP_ID=MMETSP0449_2-20121227/7377_1 /TAXON_ID=1082188 /ORGANISM="Strombidium rassoulzadegani, Strain ras09" /LENGTH=1171 /DNA_ID=CAMNT_0008661923 /DNA_START=74 /DNA_END=3586 /DNA_ORIENTATION=+
MDIEDIHPLRARAKLDHIIPALQVFRRCRKPKKDFKHSLRKTLLEEMGIKMPDSENQLIEEPFLMLGYGINAYFDIMLSLCLMFFSITLFCLPLYYMFAYNDAQGLKNFNEGFKFQITKWSLGNMGGSTVICFNKAIKSRDLKITCPNAQNAQIDIQNVQFGVMSQHIENKVFCSNENQQFIDALSDSSIANCTARLDTAGITKTLTERCTGKAKCEMDLGSVYDPSKWTYDGEDQCGDNASFFVQVPCLIKPEDGPIRRIFGLMSGCIAVFIYLFTVIFFDYIKSVQTNKFIDFDVKTITAGDYTIEFDLEAEMFEKFQKDYHDESNPISEIAQFKLYIQSELEQRLSEFPDLGIDEPGSNAHGIKIAQITFAFENSKVISWLLQRGLLIKKEQWEKVDEINDTIAEALKEREFLDKMQRPVSVFVTMETEEGYNRASMYNDLIQMDQNYSHYQNFLGGEIELQEASEPTDIIWENRAFKPRERQVKRAIGSIIILIMLAVSASIIFFCSIQSNIRKFRYPKGIDCQDFVSQYHCSEEDFTCEGSNFEAWQEEARNEFHVNRAKQKHNKATNYFGSMQCLCGFIAEKDALQGPSLKAGELTEVEKFTIPDDLGVNSGEDIQICAVYQFDKTYSAVLGQGIAFIIIAINIVLKTIIIKLIVWIGEDTISERLASITNGVFYAQFFNTGFLLLLVNANMTEHGPHLFTHYFAGRYHDYMPDWYADVGQKITQTMLINSILPYVNLVMGFALPGLFRGLDTKFSGNVYATKKSSMAQYKQLYSGADYTIHFKYSGVLNIVYITMMYGLGMPILFALAAFNFLNQYICERFIVAYQVKLPAALDDKLTNGCINMLKWAPILFLFNGYWMISNSQIFENRWSPVDSTIESMKSGHFVTFQVNWATPVLFMVACSIPLIAAQKIFAEQLVKWGFGMSSTEIAVDEDLPNFFKAVKLSHADELVLENENMEHNFKVMPHDPDTIETLNETQIPNKAVQGTPWYQILSNPMYANSFYYVGAFIPEREKLIEDGYPDTTNKDHAEEERQVRFEQSDMVMILLNLAYIPDAVITGEGLNKANWEFEFKAGWQFYFKTRMEEYIQHFNQRVANNEVLEKVDSNGNSFQLVFDHEWDFQSRETEERYLAFKRQRDEALGVKRTEKPTNFDDPDCPIVRPQIN